MCNAANFHLDSLLIEACNLGNVLLATCINGVWYKLFHLLAAAYYRNT
jgi:hypothetical protein